jgi:hypothetical protein
MVIGGPPLLPLLLLLLLRGGGSIGAHPAKHSVPCSRRPRPPPHTHRDHSEGSDTHAVSSGWVSVTPLSLRSDVPLRLVRGAWVADAVRVCGLHPLGCSARQHSPSDGCCRHAAVRHVCVLSRARARIS